MSVHVPQHMRINAADQALLKEAWQYIEPYFSTVINDFYQALQSDAVASKILAGKDIEHLKKAQQSHWQQAAHNGMDAAYQQRTVNMGKAHAVIGLDSSTFVMAYSFLAERFQQIIIAAHKPWQIKKVGPLMAVLNRMMFMDLSLSIHAYDKHMEQMANERVNKVLDEFHKQVGDSIGVITSAASELDSTAAVTVDQVGRSTQVAQTTVSSLAEATTKVEGLSEMAHNIDNVVQLIRAVADQTNLLALNASIEAARAGDAGKGFAVVADEVKKLSEEVSKATDEIASHLTQIQTSADASSASIHGLNDHVGAVRESLTEIERSMQEQKVATREIADSSTRIEQDAQQTAQRLRS